MQSKLQFTIIGYIEWRKGQDLLLDAVDGLPEELASACNFLLVGSDSSVFAGKIRDRIRNKPWIQMCGSVSREEVHTILNGTDVLICPSREDPMPTVCAEAMLYNVPCMVSDATGTAAFLADGYNGMVFKSGETEELREKIAWSIRNSDKLGKMGRRAHLIYEQHFSEKKFEESLLRHVGEMCGARD